MNKKSFVGYTTKELAPCWTIYNTFNLAGVVQKTKNEAIARYEDGLLGKNIIKVKITIEEVKE